MLPQQRSELSEAGKDFQLLSNCLTEQLLISCRRQQSQQRLQDKGGAILLAPGWHTQYTCSMKCCATHELWHTIGS